MKDEPKSPSTKVTPLPVAKHELEHAVPTVIHNPEDDMPVLARWVSHAMENQTRFWTLLGGLVAAVVAIVVVANNGSAGRSGSDEAWSRLETAKSPADRVDVAKEFGKSPAAPFALLQAAIEFYSKALDNLPSNRDAAEPELKKALDLFEQAEQEAPKDSPQARAAALGAARTLEARNQIDKAIARYKTVAKTWPDSDEAKEADRLAQWLQKPESREFYEKLYAYKPPTATLAPGETGRFDLPIGHPPIGGGSPRSPLGPLRFPSPLSPLAPRGAADTPADMDTPPLPPDVFAPAPAPKADPGKPEAAKPGLPADPFAPAAKP